MKRNAILIGLSILLFFSTSAQEIEDSDRIFWEENYNLKWSDFQSEEAPDGTGVAAESSIALPYRYRSDGEGTLDVFLNVCFVKSQSWSNKEKQNEVLLQHEKLHFDIAELHRRMIVKKLLETKFEKQTYKEQLESIINEIWIKKYPAMQDKYDEETSFSRIIREQVNWNAFVEKQMEAYSDYTAKEVNINLIHFD